MRIPLHFPYCRWSPITSTPSCKEIIYGSSLKCCGVVCNFLNQQVCSVEGFMGFYNSFLQMYSFVTTVDFSPNPPFAWMMPLDYISTVLNFLVYNSSAMMAENCRPSISERYQENIKTKLRAYCCDFMFQKHISKQGV